jgi:LPXTG-motif cell wall-anchored protein
LAFTGTNAIGIGALGGLLLVGGGAMVFAGRRRKENA